MAKNNGDIRRRKDGSIAGLYYTKKFRWLNTCVYCGQPATCKDHVFPLHISAKLNMQSDRVRFELKGGLYIVPCCTSCNQIAGGKP